MSIREWLVRRFGFENQASRAQLAEAENSFLVGTVRYGASERERPAFNREEVLEQAVEAWRTNPLARRIVELTTQYMVGNGLRVTAEDDLAQQVIDEFWQHPLNNLDLRLYEWADELTRSGELFLLLSTDQGGASYVRALPSERISEISTAENDYTQELRFTIKPAEVGGRETCYPGAACDPGRADDGSYTPVMLHYAVNRPVGTVRGESDLAPLLRWLSRYSGWLEDRARLNRYRNTFLFVVKAAFASEAERLARQQALALNPPSPGSILVADTSEQWEVLNPQLHSSEAGEDGLSLKKMIAAGAGLPLHFLAEPESATRTTAEAAGGPTYRRFEQRQRFFCKLVEDLLRHVLRRHALAGALTGAGGVTVSGGDLSARDNAALAVSASTMTAAMGDLRDRQVIDDEELLRMVYEFAGQNVDLKDLLERGKKAGKRGTDSPVGRPPGGGGAKVPPVKVGPDGEPRGNAMI
jgi:hypothetical protein